MRRALALAASLVVVGGLTAPATAQTDGAPVEIQVLDRGKGPRSELRYAFEAGSAQAAVLSVNSSIGQRINGQLFRGNVPQIEMDVEAAIDSVTPEGDASLSFTYLDARVAFDSVDEYTEEQILESLQPIIGLSGTLELTARGEALSTSIDVPADLDPTSAQLVQSIVDQSRTLTVPLPEEPMGVGARWEATTTAVTSGLETTQTYAYEVVDLSSDGAEIDVSVVQRAPRQTFTPPGTDTEVTLLSSKGTGSGTFELSFDQPLPTVADLHIQVRQKLRGGGDRISQTVTLNLFIDPA